MRLSSCIYVPSTDTMKLSLIIPAYNEEKRIERTLRAYSIFFDSLVFKRALDYEIIVVINNTRDRTEEIVLRFQKNNPRVRYLKFKQGGKGFAISEGFRDALRRDAELIGFVDADMATGPASLYDLVKAIDHYEGAIANRYDSRSKLTPRLTFRRIIVARIFNFIVRSLFSISYKDTQCGAKLFTRHLVESVLPDLTITQWAYDIDLLYLATKKGFRIQSVPTSWMDVEGSKIRLVRSSLEMIFAIIQLRILHSRFVRVLIPLNKAIGLLYRFLTSSSKKVNLK